VSDARGLHLATGPSTINSGATFHLNRRRRVYRRRHLSGQPRGRPAPRRQLSPAREIGCAPGPTAIVLLGSGSFTAHDWRDNTFSILDPTGADRVAEAARVYKLVEPAWVISSGGASVLIDSNEPDGLVMRDALVQLGVPPPRILVETESLNTHDEAVIVARMLKPLAIQHVIVVTSDIHMRRSIGTFCAAGLDAIPAAARSPVKRPPWDLKMIPSEEGLEEAAAVAHELLGVGYYTLRGWFR
jgi:uncharacterized SAM-binding protein YcdF (DUF218 family)